MIHNVSWYNILATSSIARRTYNVVNRKAPRTHGDESNQGYFKFGFRISMLEFQSHGMFLLGCESKTFICRSYENTYGRPLTCTRIHYYLITMRFISERLQVRFAFCIRV